MGEYEFYAAIRGRSPSPPPPGAGGSSPFPVPRIDLQWFAAEDEGRTEEPTDITYRKAREEGRVAKSQELTAALLLLLPGIALLFLAPWMMRTCVEMVRFFFLRAVELDPVKDGVIAGVFFTYLAKLALPLALTAVAAAVFANLVQTGPLFTTKPLTPDFSRILPRFGRYFQRTLFSMEGLFNLGKNIAKMAVIGAAAYILFLGPLVTLLTRIINHSGESAAINTTIGKLVSLQQADLWLGLTFIANIAAKLLIVSALLLLALSLPDLFFQRWQFRQSLKMTRAAAKEEQRQYEGDPNIRARLRARYQNYLSSNQLKNVPNADVVITNPTHYAVVLEYDPDSMNAPTCTAKGEDEVALEIRRIAEENGVPVREIPPLARALYKDTEVGEEIRPYYHSIVATVLARVWDIEKKRRRTRRRGAA
jgi:flagellar biosynthetic protein FlhB